MYTNSIIRRMTLYEYINSFPCRDRKAVRRWIAEALNVSEVYVRSMSNGTKPYLYKHAVKIETLTSGLVPRHLAELQSYLTGRMVT